MYEKFAHKMLMKLTPVEQEVPTTDPAKIVPVAPPPVTLKDIEGVLPIL